MWAHCFIMFDYDNYSANSDTKFCIPQLQEKVHKFSQGGKGQLAVYYTSSQSFILTFSYWLT